MKAIILALPDVSHPLSDIQRIKPSFEVATPGLKVEWGWLDWLGFIGLLLCIGFLATGAVALYRGKNPMSVLHSCSDLLGAFFKAISRPDPKNEA
jgi:hypothetical protein